MQTPELYFDTSSYEVLTKPILQYCYYAIVKMEQNQQKLEQFGKEPCAEEECDGKIQTWEVWKNNIRHDIASDYMYIVHLREQSIRSFVYDELKRIVQIHGTLDYLYRLPDSILELNGFLAVFGIDFDNTILKKYSDIRNILKHREGKTKKKLEKDETLASAISKDGTQYVNNLVYNIKLEDIKTLKKHIEEYFINISKHNKLDIMKALEYIKDKDSKKNVCVQIMIHFIDNVREERF